MLSTVALPCHDTESLDTIPLLAVYPPPSDTDPKIIGRRVSRCLRHSFTRTPISLTNMDALAVLGDILHFGLAFGCADTHININSVHGILVRDGPDGADFAQHRCPTSLNKLLTR
jgi:hypothetical protein